MTADGDSVSPRDEEEARKVVDTLAERHRSERWKGDVHVEVGLHAFVDARGEQRMKSAWSGPCDDGFAEVVRGGSKAISAHLCGAVHGGSSLRPNLKGAELRGLTLEGAQLRIITFRGADLSQSSLKDADLQGSCFEEANLRGCDFRGANLQRAALSGACLAGANLTTADMRGSTGARFDCHDISETQLQGASFPWLTLRRSYSGPMVLLHAMLLILFFAPFVARGGLHLANTQAVEAGQAVVDELAPQMNGKTHVKLAESLGLRESRLINVLLQWDDGPLLAILATILVVYAGFRFFLVWRVAPLREEEDRTRHTPALAAYLGLMRWHKIASAMLLVSILSTCWHVYVWLMEPVLVAARPN